jgi:hypothetical protein
LFYDLRMVKTPKPVAKVEEKVVKKQLPPPALKIIDEVVANEMTKTQAKKSIILHLDSSKKIKLLKEINK